ncbi:MAG: enolase C-terminal domain-like protein [Halodesulfurarchaeum sp.]
MQKPTIESIGAMEILDCRLDPTLRVTVETTAGRGRADVPVGRSTGKNEVVERRDGGPRYRGRGVRTAVETVEDVIAPEFRGREVTDQRALDDLLWDLDGTETLSNLGGNATTGVSLAIATAAADSLGLPLFRYLGRPDSHVLPVPFLDVIEGGELAATDLPFQEHQLVPTGTDSFAEAIRRGAEVYYELGDRLAAKWGEGARNVGSEGGYTPAGMADPRDAFDAMLGALSELGLEDEFDLAIDAAASHVYVEETDRYHLGNEVYTTDELAALYEDLVSAYPLISIEDPFAEHDFEAFASLTRSVDAQIIGDDLFVSHPNRIRQGIETGAGTALLLKVNQIGTLSGAMDAARTAFEGGYAVQVSERSGQTPDTWLADLAVALNAGQIKTGVTRGERTEQYNRLLEIEAELGSVASYPDSIGPTEVRS